MRLSGFSVHTTAAQQAAFQRLWSLKESLVKARGDGLAFELHRAQFALRPDAAPALLLDGAPAHDAWCVPA